MASSQTNLVVHGETSELRQRFGPFDEQHELLMNALADIVQCRSAIVFDSPHLHLAAVVRHLNVSLLLFVGWFWDHLHFKRQNYMNNFLLSLKKPKDRGHTCSVLLITELLNC